LLKNENTFQLFSVEYIIQLKNNINEEKLSNTDWAVFILLKYIQNYSLYL
jgi:hypothetical protein